MTLDAAQAREKWSATDKVAAVTVGEVWAAYIEERRPHWDDGEQNDREMDRWEAALGGQKAKQSAK